MAEMQWTKPLPAGVRRASPAWIVRLPVKLVDLEDLLTLFLLLGAIVSVSATLEGGGWSESMPALTLVSTLAAITALTLNRSRMSMLLAWPTAVLIGGLIVFWQALVMVGPGNVEYRLDQLWFRFDLWFHQAFNDQVSHDPLPFHVLVLGITWLGVFLFGWSVFRWHNAWIGLVPGGVALFVDLAFVGDELSGSALLYYLFGFLLVMRTNLTARIEHWRAEGIDYPSLLSLTFLNFSAWALLALITLAWIAPTGPFSTPGFVRAGVTKVMEIGTEFVRLAGPLEVKKIVPVHNYGSVLPFQGSVSLGGRELMTVQVQNPELEGPFILRGAVYDKYGSGGWQAGEREEIELPPEVQQLIMEELEAGEVDGTIIPMRIEIEAKSVIGSVAFTSGQALGTDLGVDAQVPKRSIRQYPVDLPGGARLSDRDVMERLPDHLVGLGVVRDGDRRVQYVKVVDREDLLAPDAVVLQPDKRLPKGKVYNVTSFVRTATPDELRAAGNDYPAWVLDEYLQLPDTLPGRVGEKAAEVAPGSVAPDFETPNAYDIAKAIETYLRGFPIDYDVPDTPPGRDTVDYFLFDLQRGYFDYHASAMVVMLRTLGVPARLGVGFVVDEGDYHSEREGYIVRDKSSYAWAEVYFPGYGWMVFNPTPDRPEELAPQPRTAPLPLSDGEIDISKLPIPVGADPIFDIPNPNTLPVSGSSGSGSSDTALSPWLVVAFAAFAALLFAVFAFGWQRSVAGMPYAQQHWEKLVRLSSWAGYPPQPGQTPTDFANTIQRLFRELRGVSVVANAYNRSRYAGSEPTQDERQRIRDLWPEIRTSLVGEIFGRILRRGRRRKD